MPAHHGTAGCPAAEKMAVGDEVAVVPLRKDFNHFQSRVFKIFLTQDLGLGINTAKTMEDAGSTWMCFWVANG